MSLLDADTLPHECTIRTLSHARGDAEDENPIGGDVPSTTNRVTSQPCWVQNATRDARIDFQRRDQRLTHTVFFGEDVACEVDEEIVPADGLNDCPFAGKVLKVLDYGECTAGLAVGWKAICEQKEDSAT